MIFVIVSFLKLIRFYRVTKMSVESGDPLLRYSLRIEVVWAAVVVVLIVVVTVVEVIVLCSGSHCRLQNRIVVVVMGRVLKVCLLLIKRLVTRGWNYTCVSLCVWVCLCVRVSALRFSKFQSKVVGLCACVDSKRVKSGFFYMISSLRMRWWKEFHEAGACLQKREINVSII